MPVNEHSDEAERIVASFREHYVECSPFSEDRKLVDELGHEVVPCAQALLFARQAAEDDVASLEHREGFAMIALLGRRAAEFGATPTAALHLVPSIAAGFDVIGRALDASLVRALQSVCIEGYVASREEKIVETQQRAAANAVSIVLLFPRCVAVFLGGLQEPDMLRDVMDRVGRVLLASDASVCIVDLSQLDKPTPERAMRVFGADEVARMLGVKCIFAGGSKDWLDQAANASLDKDLVAFEPSFEAAFKRALHVCGLALRDVHWVPASIRGLLK